VKLFNALTGIPKIEPDITEYVTNCLILGSELSILTYSPALNEAVAEV